jgi:hypothetical protein
MTLLKPLRIKQISNDPRILEKAKAYGSGLMSST